MDFLLQILSIFTIILFNFTDFGLTQGYDCASQIRNVEQRCKEEAFGWINYSGIGKECCRNIALDRCMKQRVPRECQSLATNWLSPELRNWIYTACNNFNERRCEELLFHCNRQREERIADCTRIGQKTWSGESLKDRCCLSHNVEKCLKTRNIDECYDNSYSLATYLSQSRDYRLRQSCDEFTDISACEDNTWTIILLGILVLILAIVLIVLCVFLVLYCLKRRRTK